jgi:hypothetical protein
MLPSRHRHAPDSRRTKTVALVAAAGLALGAGALTRLVQP